MERIVATSAGVDRGDDKTLLGASVDVAAAKAYGFASEQLSLVLQEKMNPRQLLCCEREVRLV
jgi:hypothetical protein